MPTIELIRDEDLEEVCAFWQSNFRSKCSLDIWRDAFLRRWHPHKPNNGFLLRDGGRLVGTFGAIYSQQIIRGKSESFCNMVNWYVHDSYRNYSMALLFALTRQKGFHFTNFTPSPTAVQVLENMGFRPLPLDVTAVPNIVTPRGFSHKGYVFDEILEIEQVLSEDRRKVCRDHVGCPNVQQLAVGTPETGYCHIFTGRGRCRYLPCSVILDVSDPAMLREFWPQVSAYFLLRQKALVTRVPHRIAQAAALPCAFNLLARGKTFFLSSALDAVDVSPLYSEAVALRGC